ncbi:SMI1/KNR4 family protein [Dorea sp. YH-dor226]|uniref:SMI1/KNR4 family protein n=1 Tax=Dorea sp. YH-dor226 TaxID=3151119 RepID=UPI00324260AB
MNKITWKYVKPLKDKSAVTSFLQEHNVNLPDSLVNCLIENNGGRPSTFIFNTSKAKEYVFQSLFSYNHDDKNNIYRIYSSMFENSVIYPIGIDAAGNIICYHQKRKRYMLWNHENDKYEDIYIDDL